MNKYAVATITLLASAAPASADYTVWQTTCAVAFCLYPMYRTSSAGVYSTEAQAIYNAELAAKTFPNGTCPPGTYCKYDGPANTKELCEFMAVSQRKAGYFFCVAPSGLMFPGAPNQQSTPTQQNNRVQKLLKW
jgi:hypothetical protein